MSNLPPIIVDLGGDITMTFRHIPAGLFRMGQRGGNAGEEPVTEVQVPEFWIGETPVTQAQYRVMAEACLEELNFIDGNRGTEPSHFKDREDSAMRPVENVNWFEARVVAVWLQEKMREEGSLPPECVVDLPPEDHWEYACRAGTETDYWSGTGDAALAQAGWYAGNADSRTHPAQAKDQPNGYGLHDMHGNVNEWCLDLFEAVRGRFRLPEGNGEAYEDRSRLVRTPANPDEVAWAALFTRISGRNLKLLAEDLPVMAKLRDFAKLSVTNGDLSWEPVFSGSETALAQGGWPENQSGLAEEFRAFFQIRVDSSSDSSEPDRILRGGSWSNTAWRCRSTFRGKYLLDGRDRRGGFRLCVFLGPNELPIPAEITAHLDRFICCHHRADSDRAVVKHNH